MTIDVNVSPEIRFERSPGNVLYADRLVEGKPYLRFTFVEPINVGIFPGDYPNDKRKYKESHYKYLDAPFDGLWKEWYKESENKHKSLFLGNNVDCDLFVPHSNIASINLRKEHMGKERLHKRVAKRSRWLLYVAAMGIGFVINHVIRIFWN